mgnify:CR=1 FL=1
MGDRGFHRRDTGWDNRDSRGAGPPDARGSWEGRGSDRQRHQHYQHDGRRGNSRDRDVGFDRGGREDYGGHRMASRDRGGGRDDYIDRRGAREPERLLPERSWRDEQMQLNDRRNYDRRESVPAAGRQQQQQANREIEISRRGDERRSPSYSESDSSETEYTRKPRKWEVTLTPEQQLEALDLWLKANPEVAKDVEMLDNRSKGINNKPPPFFQEGDWLCATCNEHNWKNRMDCRGCGAPASAEKITELQAQKARVAVAQAAKPQAPNAKPGDWMCVGCTSTNYASKKNCFRCNTSKPNEWVCAVCNSISTGVENTTCGVCVSQGVP